MSAYFIISYDIVDFDEFQKYPPKVLGLVGQYEGEILASDTEAEAIEGDRKMMHAIIRFPTKEKALACFNSDEYQKEIKHHRHKSTKNTRVVLVDGFNPEQQQATT